MEFTLDIIDGVVKLLAFGVTLLGLYAAIRSDNKKTIEEFKNQCSEQRDIDLERKNDIIKQIRQENAQTIEIIKAESEKALRAARTKTIRRRLIDYLFDVEQGQPKSTIQKYAYFEDFEEYTVRFNGNGVVIELDRKMRELHPEAFTILE